MKVLYDNETVERRIGELAAEIDRDYAGRELVLIGVLTGAFIFMADLARKIKIPCRIDFVRLSSYGNEKSSSGEVKVGLGMKLPLEGMDVLVVEEIVDSGRTLSFFLEELQKSGAKSVKVCALVDKTARRECAVKINYAGFTIEDGFLVGFGMDVAENLRNLPHIAVCDD